jgi:ribonuclease P protein component
MDRQIDKIRKRRDFLAVARGRRQAERGLVLQALDRHDDAPPRAGFTVTRKVGSAVIRNRAKRRLRAAAAEILPLAAKYGYDYVLIGRHATPTRRWAELLADLRTALDDVHGSRAREPRGRSSASLSDASRSDTGKDLPHG